MADTKALARQAEALNADHPASVLFEMETSRRPEDLAKGLRRLVGMLSKDHPLRKLFQRWVRLVLLPRWLPGTEVADVEGIEEFTAMMEQEMPEWTRQNMAKGAANLLETLIREKFGALPDAIRERIESATAEQAHEWGRRILFANSLDEVFT